MKYRLSSAVIVALCVLPFAAAQSVVVTPKKVVNKRSVRNVPDFKRTFEVRYPIFSGKLKPAARRGLKSGTDYWSIFDTKLADNLKDDTWLSSFDYVVKYNKHNLLDIWLVMEGVGAYPDGETKYLVFDTRTGTRISFPDLFAAERMPELLSTIRAVVKREESKIKEEEVREALESYREIESGLRPDQIEFKHLDFTISDKGVTFLFDYNYPHVVQALEPSGEFFVSYADLKPFIRSDGLLARFVR
ncbi:MAG TPA: hypothetical protein VJ781_10320 [Pyrinomonadaceae bacterium]|nr:hypothetical protein [Pyrinomonadaceae bacterium]